MHVYLTESQGEMIATFENATYQELRLSVMLWRRASPHNSIHISLKDVTVLLSTNDLLIR